MYVCIYLCMHACMRLRSMNPGRKSYILRTAGMDTCGVLRTCEIDGSGGVYVRTLHVPGTVLK